MKKPKRTAKRKPSTKNKTTKRRLEARARKPGKARAARPRARKSRSFVVLCYYPGCKNPAATAHGMFCAALHKSLTKKEKKKFIRAQREAVATKGVLTVERSLLKRNDPTRKAPYAGGGDFPATVSRELGPAPELRRVGGCLEARHHLRLNQDDFAALIGKNHSTVEDWEKDKRKPPIWLAEMFGAFLGAQSPGHWEIMELVRTKGALAACYMLLRSAFDGPRLKSTLAARTLVRPASTYTTAEGRQRQLDLVAKSNAECEAARAADPEGFAAVDAATVVNDKRRP